MANAPNPIAPDVIRTELDRILTSPQFVGSPRLSAFLRYAVENTLAGKPDLVKESLIALVVYGRGKDYDPQVDSIVRVEASRLRNKLREFYLTGGQNSPLRMELPRGSYVPTFTLAAPVIPRPVNEGSVPLPPIPAPEPPKDLPVPQRSVRPRWVLPVAAVLAVAVLVAAWFGWRYSQQSPPAAEPISIAVLPFSDLSPAKDLDYFCDGLAEELIDDLSRVQGLAVLARTSSFRFRSASLDPSEIGRRLKVNRIVSGSVRKLGTRMRVSLQLVDARSGYMLWSQSFDRGAENVLGVQDEIAREVTGAMRLRVDAVVRGTRDAEAYELYLKGRFAYSKSTHEDERKAAEFFEQAATRDPSFAAAHAGLADALASLPLRGEVVDPGTLQKARDAAKRALTLDPKLVDGLLAEAHIARTLDYNWRRAEELYRQATSIAPGAARPHNSYGVLLSLSGRFAEAQREFEEARRLDPLSMQVNTNLVLNLYRLRRYRDAVEAGRAAIQIDPSYRNAYSPLAAALAELGETDRALEALTTLRQKSGGSLAPNHLGLQGYILAKAGRRGEAQKVIAELEQAGRVRYVPRAALADVYLGLGERAKAMDLMEDALRGREVLLAGLLVSPHTDSIRNDPRFRTMQDRVAAR